jgi:hypothetical protein
MCTARNLSMILELNFRFKTTLKIDFTRNVLIELCNFGI